MGRVYDVFDKFSIINIIGGLIFGGYLSIHQEDPNLWYMAILVVFVFTLIMTILPTIASVHARFKYKEKIKIRELIEAFILNFAMIAVCLAFGFVIGSFIIGNFSTAN